MPLMGQDNPLSFSLLLLLPKVGLWQWNVYHWKHPKLLLWNTRGRNQWLTLPQSNKRIRLMAVSPGSQSQGIDLDCFTSWWENGTETCILSYMKQSPVQVWCMIQDAQGGCTGMTQRDGLGWVVGGGFRMGNTCTPVVDSCQCMAKPIQYCKVISLQLK